MADREWWSKAEVRSSSSRLEVGGGGRRVECMVPEEFNVWFLKVECMVSEGFNVWFLKVECMVSEEFNVWFLKVECMVPEGRMYGF